jgi:CheY-like chemotaxis protein
MIPEGTVAKPPEGTVCVVDDDADIREILTDVLSLEGYNVLDAADGESALDLLRRRGRGCRLILLDLMMPDMNGWEFRRKQLEDPVLAEIPVVLLTGAGTAARSIDDLHVAGAIEKPVELDTLLAEVSRFYPERSEGRT